MSYSIGDAREFLNRYRRANLKMQRQLNRYQELFAEIEKVSRDWDGMPRGSKASDITGAYATKLAETKSALEEEQSKALQVMDEIHAVIDQVPEGQEAIVLELKYIGLHSWHDVAQIMVISEDYARGKLHRSALEIVADLLNQDKKRTQNNTKEHKRTHNNTKEHIATHEKV